MKQLAKNKYNILIEKISEFVNRARTELAKTINTKIVHTYWTIGKYLVEYEQKGKERADYGSELMKTLSRELSAKLGKGFSRSNLQSMRTFYLNHKKSIGFFSAQKSKGFPTYPKSQTMSGKLSWSHYCIVFESRRESRKAINTAGNDPYTVRFNLGNSLKPKGVSVKSLPLNSDSFTDSNKFIKDEKTVSTSGGLILMNIIPEYFSGGNNKILPRCLSNDSITLPSELASSAISSSSDWKGAFFTSKPSSSNSLITLSGTFSSEYNFGLLEDDIFFLFNQLGSVINSRENSFLGKSREIVLNDFIYCDASSNQIKNLPDHDPSIFESRSAVADFAVNDNVFVDFDSHNTNNNNSIFKTFEKNKAYVDYVLGGLKNTIFASKYKLKLPTPKELADEVKKGIPLGDKK